MSKLLEYLRLCRLCLVKENVNVPIFADSSDVRQIFLKISACLPVKVSQDDNLPKHICDSCLYKVDLLYQFWNTSVNAEKQLIQWITELGLTVTSKKDAPVHLMAQSQSHSQPHSITETIMLKEEHLEMETQQQHGYSGFDIPYQPEVNMTVGASADLDSALHEDVKVGGSKRRGRPPKQKVLVTSAPPVSVPVLAGRKRRSSATKAAAAFAAHASSDDSDADDKLASDTSEPDFEPAITKEEADSEDEEYVDNPDSLEPTTFVDASSTCDPEQAGPSGLMGAPVTTRNAAMPANTEPGLPLQVFQVFQVFHQDPDPLKLEDSTSATGTSTINTYCTICDLHFPTRHQFHRHSRMHKPRIYECRFCDKKFRYHFELMRHEENHNTNVKYPCDICDKNFKNKVYLKTHMQRHTKIYRFPCPECDKGYISKQELNRHIEVVHRNITYSCPEPDCDKSFKSRPYLVLHLRKHNETVKPQYKCEHCDKVYVSRKGVRTHTEIVHKKMSVMCDKCGKTFTAKRSLDAHKLAKHDGTKAFMCSTCGKSFSLHKYLVLHIRVHTKEKPYKCTYCNKCFSQLCTLSIHKRIHTGERPYSCKFCNKRFISKSALTLHLKIHGTALADFHKK